MINLYGKFYLPNTNTNVKKIKLKSKKQLKVKPQKNPLSLPIDFSNLRANFSASDDEFLDECNLEINKSRDIAPK